MSKRLRFASFLFLLTVFLVSSSALASGIAKVKISEAMRAEVLVDPASVPQATGTGISLKPDLILSSPGYIVGTTHYDYQASCSAGNRLEKDILDGIHIVWMNGINYWSGNRWIYYSFRDEQGVWTWPHGGIQVNTTQGAGYPQLSLLADGRAAPAYHSVGNNLYICIGLDILRGFGSFTELDNPECITPFYYLWPYETIDRNDCIHLAFAENSGTGTPQAACYTRSHDEGYTWIEPELWDTLMDLSYVLTSSRVSDKVCIAYTHPRDLVEPNQYNNDMCYYESLDGVTWNFNGGMVNVSNYQTMDTLRAYCEVDAIYDYNDDLHLLWNTPYYDEIGGFISVAECLLWHWSETTGITFVADGWWFSRPGAWNRSISKMSLGVDEENRLFALWTQFTEDDTSAAGWSNGELYMNYSADGGATWSEPENITNSPTPDCWPGECDSDHWPTLNEVVDDSLYITYINDKDAGGIPQSEGVDTENPVMYLAVPKPVAQVSMTCTTYPVFCRGSKFLFRLVVRNEGSSQVSGTLTFSVYSGHDCDPTNLLVSIPRDKTFGPGTTTSYYEFKIPSQINTGPYSASVGGTLGGSQVYCCMNTNIIRCSPWKIGDNAEWEVVEVDRPEFELPTVTSLAQNYPNPFNAETNISYSLAEAGNVSLNVYDITGRLVAALVDGYQDAGEHTVAWEPSGATSGVYLYKLKTSDFSCAKKMNLLK